MPVRSIDTLPSTALRRFAWGVLVYFIAVILWGALVRATGSGAGCGEHWPLCNGSVLQHSASVETMIEFTHRITSGLSLLAVLALLVWSLRGTVAGHLARWTAAATVCLTLMEAVLGALLVKLGLTAQSQSPLRPGFLALHLANTLLLLAALTLTAHLLNRREGYTWRSIRLLAPFGALAGVLAMMLVGVTGSLAALGDTLFPAASLGAAMRQDLSAASVWLLRWRWAHPALAVAAGILLLWILLRTLLDGRNSEHRPLFRQVMALLACVYLLGLLDVLLLAPVWVQVAHLAAAECLWVSLVALTARLTLLPDGER
jgi:cytochrome c oxidase assembly protein subunit 15